MPEVASNMTEGLIWALLVTRFQVRTAERLARSLIRDQKPNARYCEALARAQALQGKPVSANAFEARDGDIERDVDDALEVLSDPRELERWLNTPIPSRRSCP